MYYLLVKNETRCISEFLKLCGVCISARIDTTQKHPVWWSVHLNILVWILSRWTLVIVVNKMTWNISGCGHISTNNSCIISQGFLNGQWDRDILYMLSLDWNKVQKIVFLQYQICISNSISFNATIRHGAENRAVR